MEESTGITICQLTAGVVDSKMSAQEDHQYTSGKKKPQSQAKQTSVNNSMFKGRRCFICNEPLKGNTCQLSRTNTKYTNTPFSKSLNDVMGEKVGAQQSLLLKNDAANSQSKNPQKPCILILGKVAPKIQNTPVVPINNRVELYQCVQCQHITTNPNELKSHVCAKTATFNKPVTVVKETSDAQPKKVSVKRPIKIVAKKVEKLTCTLCDLSFLTREELDSHQEMHLSELTNFPRFEEQELNQSWVCISCNETFTTVESLTTHLAPVLKINANHCSSCNLQFMSKEDFNDHVASVHQTDDGASTDANLIMKLTYVCSCCQCELMDYKDFSQHREDHISRAKICKKSVELNPEGCSEEMDHDYAMDMNEPTTSQSLFSTSDKINKATKGDGNPVLSAGSKKSVYECGMCSTREDTIEKLMEHFKMHKSSKIVCKHCHIVQPSVNALSKHLQYHTQSGQGLECQMCTPSISLSNKDLFMKHMADLHKMKHQCNCCGEQFRFHRELTVHQNLHPELRKFGCPKCGLRYLKVTQLQKHIELHHRDPKCRQCGKLIKDPLKLRQHEARHRHEKFPCTKCERIFKTPSGLRNHMAIHTGEYKYRCDSCDRGFMNRNIFIEHTNNHLETPKPLYKCDICNKNFFYQGSLWIHRKWHKNPYPYECKLCGKKLRHASVLQVHMRKHRGERPYKCPYCPLNFNSPSTFKRHLMLHTGEYAYKCDECNKGFTGKNKFQLHRHQVHGEAMPKKQAMSEKDFKVNVPVKSLIQESSTLDGHPAAYIVESMGNPDTSNDDDSMAPRVIEVVINEEQQAVSSITLLGDSARWA
ncbi:hypothetical protein B566_EDAN002966 [Ephemera danica]|nr:hypothetical protein B566_EDAN002966 [Ephemera danica]